MARSLQSWVRMMPLHAKLCRVAAPALVAVASTACDHHAFSPPARSLPLETAATMPQGSFGLQAEGGAHGTIFGPTIYAGTARARYGVDDSTELSGEASLMNVAGVSAASTNPNIYSARVGFKHRLLPFEARSGPTLSVTGGVGAGGSAGGGFLSPDLGAIVSWENAYVVPFAAVRGSLSQPVASQPVDTSGSGDKVGTFVNVPELTWIGGLTAGIRLPLDWMIRGPVRAALLGGVGWTGLRDSVDSTSFVSAEGGAELVF